MNKTYERIVWENYTSTNTPLNATNLNKMDSALNEIDNRVVNFDTTKANQNDLLQSLKSVTYNTQTGVFTFTYWNGNTLVVDLNIEKIPVQFSMSPEGIITMRTADGTEYTCDVASLIKTYSFQNTGEITWTVTTDASGNKTVIPSLNDGGISQNKLEVNFLANCLAAQGAAEDAADEAKGYAENSAEAEQAVRDAMGFGTFIMSDEGHLMYEDNAVWNFEVNDNGHLLVEVV